MERASCASADVPTLAGCSDAGATFSLQHLSAVAETLKTPTVSLPTLNGTSMGCRINGWCRSEDLVCTQAGAVRSTMYIERYAIQLEITCDFPI